MKHLRFICLFILVTILTACGKEAETKVASRPVKTFVIHSAQALFSRSFPGKISANKHVDLAFQVPGQIIKLSAKEGQKVEKGQLLAALDARDYQHAYDEDKARLDYSQVTFQRYNALLKRKVVPQSEYDKARADYQIAIAKTNTAKKALEDTNLIAPYTGVVAKRYVENFENINAKQPILSLQEIDTVEVKVDVPENFIFVNKSKAKQHDNQPVAYVVFEALPNKKFPATLKEISTDADEVTQTYEVTLMMKPPQDVNVLPGMSVTTYPVINFQTSQFSIPSSAVMTDENGQHYVWLVDNETSQVKKQVVKVGAMKDEHIIISSGLKEDDVIVAAGGIELREGMKVRLLEKKKTL